MSDYFRLFFVDYWIEIFLVVSLVPLSVVSCAKKDVMADSSPSSPSSLKIDSPSWLDESSALEKVFFEFDKSKLSASAAKILSQNLKWLKQSPDTKVRIEGHCDERGSKEYNDKLGSDRALAVRDYLRKHGIRSDRLVIVSFGKIHPINLGHDESAWAENRRVAFRIVF